MDPNIGAKIKLSDGNEIPQLGFGVFQIADGQYAKTLMKQAFQLGYRHVDTARVYGNERSVGDAVRQSYLPRNELYVATKLWNTDQGYDSTLRACEESIKQLGLDYIDLYIIHWPVEEERLQSWKAMERLREEGMVKSIGVSNFMLNHLEELLQYCNVKPVINQIELHPYNYGYRFDIIEFCLENDIRIEAYAPLTRGHRLTDPKLVQVAEKYDKTSAQVLIKWSLQKGFIVIPKSAHIERIEENANVFDFVVGEDDMRLIDSFNQDLIVCWDPTDSP